MQDWFLEGSVDHRDTLRKLRVDTFPFIIGRHSGLALSIHSVNVSRHHAEIFKKNGRLMIKDLKSTNGTFVNREPVHGEVELKGGDVLHLADIELRLTLETAVMEDGSVSTELDIGGAAVNLPVGFLEIKEMLSSELVSSVFQPIWRSKDETLLGFEILGRGVHPKLPRSPAALFKIAENAHCEVDLVELMRYDGVRRAHFSSLLLSFFINIHPKELDNPNRLLRSIQAVRKKFPHPHLILEIHEHAVTDIKVMGMMRRRLCDLGVGLAYDDFGAGQARLLELSEVPPDYLKFDISLIKKIEESASRRALVGLLLQISKKMNILTLAEGVSNQREAAACHELGFDLVQGFYYGRPADLEKVMLYSKK